MSAVPASIDFFASLGIPRHLAIDLRDLETRYYALIRKLHPDLFARKPQLERDAADAQMAVLNDAWRTLRDPIKRALYVLKQDGFDIGEQGTKDVPPELLEEVFELNMALDEQEDVSSVVAKFEKMRDDIDASLARKFSAFDAGEPNASDQIRGLINRRKYITNLIARANNVPDRI
jgi:molecular chaperone HscB